MRFTCTSSAGSPRGPSASVTVHRSSFGALRRETRRIGMRETFLWRPYPPPTGTTHPPASRRPWTVRPGKTPSRERGQLPPGGSRDRASRAAPQPDDSGRVGALRWGSRARGPDVPREAVRRREHPGRGHQDAAAQRLPAELQPHQPGPGPRRCRLAPDNAAVRPRHVDVARAPLATRPWKGRRGTSQEAQVPVVLTIETPPGFTLRSALLSSPPHPKPLQPHLAQVNPAGGGLEAWDAQVLLRNTPLSLTATLPLFSTPGWA